MFSFCKKPDDSPANRVVDVGWLLDTDKASFIWDAPRKMSRPPGRTAHAKGVSVCPAVNDHESRLFEVTCPVDIQLRYKPNGDEPGLINLAGDQSTIRPSHLNKMFAIVNRKEWRDPNRPILQFMTPYVFLADEAVTINQLPPFYHPTGTPWPGLLIGGRFPIDVWPRGLVWAFEWYDTSKDLIIKRGEPWFYVSFETIDPSRRVRLVEAENTPALTEYMNGIKGVTNYVNRTFSLFNVAKERRPKTLLVPKQR
ncbi:MAG: hypothetical protein V4735_00160 [Pseudomonadota bacterium]